MEMLQYTADIKVINNEKDNIKSSINSTIGLLLFLTTATMFFVGLIGAYIIMHPSLPGRIIHKFAPVLTVNTFVLLLSSMTMFFAQLMSFYRKTKLVTLSLFFTIITGLIFLLLQIFLWNEMAENDVTLSTPLGANIYLFSGAHLLHFLGGLLSIGTVNYKLAFGFYLNEDYKKGVTLCGIYWHFVNAIWLIIYILLVFWK